MYVNYGAKLSPIIYGYYGIILLTLDRDARNTSYFHPIRLLDPGCWYKSTYMYMYLIINSADPDQMASSEGLKKCKKKKKKKKKKDPYLPYLFFSNMLP